jgi:hypothetical protein
MDKMAVIRDARDTSRPLLHEWSHVPFPKE